MPKNTSFAALAALLLAAPVAADPSIGFGLSFAFGGGGMETGVGVRIFSDNEQDSVAATAGLDYMFQSDRIRPTLGAAYLGDDRYFGFDVGFGMNGRGMDYGVSAGFVETEGSAEPSIVCGQAEILVDGNCVSIED